MRLRCRCRGTRLRGRLGDYCNLLKYTRNGVNLSVVPFCAMDGNRVVVWIIEPSTQCFVHHLLVRGQEIYMVKVKNHPYMSIQYLPNSLSMLCCLISFLTNSKARSR